MGLNFKKLKEDSGDGDFSPLPEDRYNLVIENGEPGVSKNGNDKIEFTLKVIEGDYENRKVWHTFSLVPKAQIYLLRFLEAAGSDVIEEEDASKKDIIKSVVGKHVNAFVEQEKTNNGNIRNVINGNFKPYTSEDTSPKASSGGEDSSGKKKSKLFS